MPRPPSAALRQAISRGAVRFAARLCCDESSLVGVARRLSGRFATLAQDEIRSLISMGQSALRAGRLLDSLPRDRSLSLPELPLLPASEAAIQEGGRSTFTGTIPIIGPDGNPIDLPWVIIGPDTMTPADLQQQAALLWASNFNMSPDSRFGDDVTPTDFGTITIISAERSF
jgi:hypothetical protein